LKIRDFWLVQSVEHGTLDLGVVSSRPMVGTVLKKKKKITFSVALIIFQVLKSHIAAVQTTQNTDFHHCRKFHCTVLNLCWCAYGTAGSQGMHMFCINSRQCHTVLGYPLLIFYYKVYFKILKQCIYFSPKNYNAQVKPGTPGWLIRLSNWATQAPLIGLFWKSFLPSWIAHLYPLPILIIFFYYYILHNTWLPMYVLWPF